MGIKGRFQDDPMYKVGVFKGEGNYLGKARRNFYLSNRSFDLLHQLSLEYGINHSNILELAIREMYVKTFGPVPPIEYADGREPLK